MHPWVRRRENLNYSLELFGGLTREAEALDRRSFLKGVGLAGAGAVAASVLAGCGGNGTGTGSRQSDQQILGAAKIAEALAVTMYASFIASPIYAGLASDDQAYFNAAMNEEKFHYDLLKASTGGLDAGVNYYFPANTFTDVQTTMNTIVTLEEAFIAAYMVGCQALSTSSLRLLAAQIMGVEAEHKVLAREVSAALSLTSTTGLSGTPENVSPPNNTVYQRTFGVSNITVAVTALTPFIDATAAGNAGYTVHKVFNPAQVADGTGLVGNPPS